MGTWYNFATGKKEERAAPTTYREALNYIPQDGASLNLFGLYQEQGLPLREAMTRVLQKHGASLAIEGGLHYG